MPTAVLTLAKLAILAMLYVFLARALRVVLADLYGPSRRRQSPTRPAVAQAPTKRKARRLPRELVVHRPDGQPQVVNLDGAPVIFGRADDVDVFLDDIYVSDEHAEVSELDGFWQVRDLGSTNGTYLNNAKVTRWTPLSAGDQIRVGKTAIEVRR